MKKKIENIFNLKVSTMALIFLVSVIVLTTFKMYRQDTPIKQTIYEEEVEIHSHDLLPEEEDDWRYFQSYWI